MKPFLTFFLFSFFLSSLFAQEYEYVPFPTEGAIWKTDMWGSVGCHPTTGLCEQVAIGTGEAVAINDTTYIGIYSVSLNTGEPFGSPQAAIRIEEDSINRRVWIRATTGLYQNEILLYDFNLIVGDTVPFMSWSDYTSSGGGQNVTSTITIASIDTVVIGEYPRKRFHLLQDGLPSETKIIEGIGSTSGLGPRVEFWSFEHWWDLQCFLLDGEFVYGQVFDQGYIDFLLAYHHTFQYCQALMDVKGVTLNDGYAVQVFPNPISNNQFEVKIELEVRDVEVYNQIGCVLPIQWKQVDGKLAVSGQLSPGMSIVRIITENNLIIKTKVLCQK